MYKLATLTLLAGCVMFAGATHAIAQPQAAQIVAVDECDPATFNAVGAGGPGECLNVAFGAQTTFANVGAEAEAGTPDANWAFEPTQLTIKKGATLSVANQGGEPHTFTEVAQYGGGFIPPLNGPNEAVAPECANGFSNVAVAKTRILQGSHLNITGLSKGKHLFECCIHPWMRIEVDVK